MKNYTTLRLILGDQLNAQHSWFQKKDDDVLYLLMEVLSETDYVKHHIQKLLMFFGAMRTFAQELQEAGHHAVYYKLSDKENQQSFLANCKQLIQKYSIKKVEYQYPDEYRLDAEFKKFEEELGIPVEALDSEHFLTERNQLAEFFKGKKTYLMESFYRDMRKRYNIMLKDGEPEGGKWNYDGENRKKLPKDHKPTEPLVFSHDLSDIKKEIDEKGVDYFGEVDEKALVWPINRKEALKLLDFFCKECLPLFGHYQDAMAQNEWSVYHSRVSFALNTKMLSPKEVVDAVIAHWRKNEEDITIAQVEGFVRQIIGWREYMRGVYWAHMPEYASKNHFSFQQPLPSWYWTGKTKMNCMKQAIGQSLKYAYAHHIQRLMITGNFALLLETDPDEVDQWYLGVYIDAIEWVEITNTRGMSQFADGGIVGTKPYISSGSYVDKMSDYCGNCYYNKKEKVGEKACPFNSLYWHFLDKQRDKLGKNPRMSMIYRTWEKMHGDKRAGILERAQWVIENREEL